MHTIVIFRPESSFVYSVSKYVNWFWIWINNAYRLSNDCIHSRWLNKNYCLAAVWRWTMSWLTEHLFGAKNSNGANAEVVEHEPIDQVVAEGNPAPPTPKETITTVANATAPTDGVADVLSAPTMQLQLDSDHSYEKREIVAEWRVPLRGKLHKIEFEHGTTSGRRVLWIDEKVCNRKPIICSNPSPNFLNPSILMDLARFVGRTIRNLLKLRIYFFSLYAWFRANTHYFMNSTQYLLITMCDEHHCMYDSLNTRTCKIQQKKLSKYAANMHKKSAK